MTSTPLAAVLVVCVVPLTIAVANPCCGSFFFVSCGRMNLGPAHAGLTTGGGAAPESFQHPKPRWLSLGVVLQNKMRSLLSRSMVVIFMERFSCLEFPNNQNVSEDRD